MSTLTPEPDGRLYATHPPGATTRITYALDWSTALDAGESIVSSTWAVEPATDTAITLSSAGLTGTTAQVTAEGGTLGTDHLLVNSITKNNGDVDKRTLTLRCRWL